MFKLTGENVMPWRAGLEERQATPSTLQVGHLGRTRSRRGEAHLVLRATTAYTHTHTMQSGRQQATTATRRLMTEVRRFAPGLSARY